MTGVSILGAYQTDFARNWAKENVELGDAMREVVEGTLNDAGIGPDAIESIHVGNAFGQLYTGQVSKQSRNVPFSPK